MIRELHLKRVGPAPEFNIAFADRLNLFTGCNGLGKTFLLDIAWWAFTNTQAGDPAWPQRGKGEPVAISYHLVGKAGSTKEPTTSRFDLAHQLWPRRTKARPVMPGLVIYARFDGSCSVCDPVRNYWKNL